MSQIYAPHSPIISVIIVSPQSGLSLFPHRKDRKKTSDTQDLTSQYCQPNHRCLLSVDQHCFHQTPNPCYVSHNKNPRQAAYFFSPCTFHFKSLHILCSPPSFLPFLTAESLPLRHLEFMIYHQQKPPFLKFLP